MPPFSLERRRRRNRRLTLLGLALVVLIGSFASLYLFMRSRDESAARQRVADSIAAYEASDHDRVIELLEDPNTNTNTLRITSGDPDALWRYVQSRLEVELRNGEHIARLFPALKQVVALDPGNYEAGTLYLDILMAHERFTEALDTADRLVLAHPDQTDLLRVRYALNMRLNQDEAALRDALAAAQQDPLHVRTQIDVATLMQKLNRDPEAFFNLAEQLMEEHPGDPRAELILARAWLLKGHALEALDLLKSASDREAPDDDFVRVLVETLDRLQQYDESYAYLQRNVGPGLDDPLSHELFLRDFEWENYRAVTQRAATLNPDEANTNIVALTAISSQRLGDTAGARAALGQLESREDDELAKHWVRCLKTMWLDPARPGELVAACAAACKDNPHHAYLHYLLAEAYRTIGEHEAALSAMQVTHTFRPSWAHPYYVDAELLLALGRDREAFDAAKHALNRRSVLPYAAVVGVAQARAANVNDQIEIDRALAFIDEKVQAQLPNEPRTYVAAIELLARAGQTERAVDRTRSALELEDTLPQDALMQLAAVSQEHGLRMEQAIYARSRAAYGADPRMVLEQAVAAADTSTNDEAMAVLRNAMPTPAPLPWRFAEAQLLQYLGDASAPAAWVKLADDFPADLEAQRLALTAVGVRADRAFADRVIQRMQSLSGPDSVGWKIERARYLLGSDDPSAIARQAEQLLQQVIATAPNRVEAYRLLAHCQTLRGDNAGAARSIEQAANLSPEDMRIQFQLGQLLHNQRQFIAARQPLLRVARDERADPVLRLNALVLLSRQDEVDTLIPILEGMRRQYVTPDQQEILLANLYTVTGRENDADEICELMLREPTPRSIAYAAEYYWRTGRPDDAKRVVELVNTVEMPADVRSTILGQHAARLGEVDLALNHYRAAAMAAPTLVDRWENLVVLGLVFGRPSEAISDARKALEHVPDAAGMRAIVDNAELISTIAGDPRFRPVAATIAGDPAHRTVGVRALRLVVESSRSGRSTAEVARDLAALANEHTQYLPLQNLAAGLLSDVRQYEPAAEIATRTLATFPADATSARIATVALAQSGEWRRAISASQAWARRSPSQKPFADVYLAAAQRNLGRVDDALQTLQPHVAEAQAAPDRYPTVLGEYATALVYRGRIEQAWTVLQPLLDRGPAWRELAMNLAATALPNAGSATRWFDAIQLAVPNDATSEQIFLAQSVFRAGDRLRDTTLIARAKTFSETATALPGATADAWFLRGRIADLSGDLPTAEESYRQVLRLQPDTPLAKNNLAMVLVQRGRNLDEAVRLAESASASLPGDPNLRDTLARVLSRVGRHDEALRNIELAIQQDRQNLAWVRTKADILERAGRADEAERLRQRYGLVAEVTE